MDKNEMVRALYEAILEKQEDGKRFVGVLDRHILDGTTSVVFMIKSVDSDYQIRFCLPLSAEEHEKLGASGYTPVLRSKHRLTLGLWKCADINFAYCAVRLPAHGGVRGLIDTLPRLGKELERFIAAGGP